MFGGDDFSRDWPPSRITDLLVSQSYPVVLMDNVLFDKKSAPPAGFEMVYVFTDMLRSYFFVFAFFVAHWFFFSTASIRQKILQRRWSMKVKSVFDGAYWKALMVFVLVVLLYWISSYVCLSVIGSHVGKPGIGAMVVFVANHLFLLVPLLIFLWWAAFSAVQSMINVVLVKIFILRRDNSKELK